MGESAAAVVPAWLGCWPAAVGLFSLVLLAQRHQLKSGGD